MSIDFTTLPSAAGELKSIIVTQAGRIDLMQRDIESLEEEIRLLRYGRFASKSEQMLHPGMKSMFPDHVPIAEQPGDESRETLVKEHTRTHNARQPFPDHFPREDVKVDLPDSDKVCDCCGESTHLCVVSEKISEKLHVKPAQYVVRRFIRPIYSCKKCETMKSAALPGHPIAKCSVTTETLAAIAVGKYMDSLPLYRQEQIFERNGVEIGRDKMSRWMIQIGERLKPLIGIMHRELLSGSLLSMDETTTQVLKEQDRLPTSKSFMIVQARGDPGGKSIALFHYSPSRSRDVMSALLKGYRGILLTDGLGVYDAFGVTIPGILHAGCWAHSRRKFAEAQRGAKATSRKGSLAAHGMMLVDRLFAIEAETANDTSIQRHQVRTERSKPIINELKIWLEEKVDQVPNKSLIGKAIRYTLNQWSKLTRFLEDGEIPIHNNFVENMIRPFAIGRKNWMFSDTPEGAEANAVLYSLLVTAKINGLHPNEYLTRALGGISTATTDQELTSLLPFRSVQ